MKSYLLFRAVTVAHAALVCLQPVLAGIYLNGSGAANRIHEPVGMTAALVCLGQLLAATVYWRAGGRVWPVPVTLLIFLAEGFQIAMGFSRQLAIHVPLGIAIVAATVALAIWTCGPAARVRRTAKPAEQSAAVPA